MATNKILLTVNVSTSFTLFSYILCIFVCGLVKKNLQILKSGKLIPNCGKYGVTIILDDKTLQYFHVPIAYQIQQIVYKTMGMSILVSIFKHDSNTHWQKEGWGCLTSKSYDKTP